LRNSLTVYEGLRTQMREVIASIAPAWRSANCGAWQGEPIAASCGLERDVTSFPGPHGTLIIEIAEPGAQARTDVDLIDPRLKAARADYEVRYGKANQER